MSTTISPGFKLLFMINFWDSLAMTNYFIKQLSLIFKEN